MFFALASCGKPSPPECIQAVNSCRSDRPRDCTLEFNNCSDNHFWAVQCEPRKDGPHDCVCKHVGHEDRHISLKDPARVTVEDAFATLRDECGFDFKYTAQNREWAWPDLH